jgi:ComF family protein
MAELPILPQSCPRCATILPMPLTANLRCGECLKHPPAFDTTYALFSYETPITKLIMELKFHQKLVNAELLGKLMANALTERWYYNKPKPDVIIPIPLHPIRLQERGFNQALEIARPISKALHIPIDILSCQRIKHTEAQAQLLAENRGQNMKNSFRINATLKGKHIAVVDDVITTGHTENSGSKPDRHLVSGQGNSHCFRTVKYAERQRKIYFYF